jgi:sarcosine oxidase subunit gamma
MVELTRRHPLSSIEPELAFRNNEAVSITAEPFVAMVDVRLRGTGNPLSGVQLPSAADTWVANGSGRAIWLGPDEWLVTNDTLAPQQLEAELRETVLPLGGVAVDVSAQRIGLPLKGSRVRDLLAKGCSIDLHPRVFGPGRAVQTTVGLAGVILLALSAAGDDFLLLVRSSFAIYLTEWLLDAAEEFTVPAQLVGATTTTAPISTQE